MARITPEPEILEGRRAFLTAQATFDRVPDRMLPTTYDVAWYGTAVNPQRGSFAIVQVDGPLDDLVGDHLRVWSGARSVNVYVLGRGEDLDTPLAITRRSFMALGLLSEDAIRCRVEVLT